MSGIVFINYRRRDAEHVAGRLFDRLEQDFSQDQLFFDVDNIPPGEDFVAFLNRQVEACDVLLAIVGPHWRSQLDARHYGDGEQTKDFVRIEIEAALAKGKKVIPVLVSGAEMPREEDLPESLWPFSRRNAVRLSHERFKADVAGITSALKAALAEAEDARAAARAEEARQRSEAEREAKARAKHDASRRESIAGLSPEQIVKAEELANWDFVKDRDDAQEFRDHLARFPEGVCARMASEKLEALVWRDLGSAPAAKALRSFLDEFPEGAHADAARSRLDQLKKAEAERRAAEKDAAQERAAWETVKETTDHETLAAFLADWPRGAHAAEARRLKKALAGGHFTRRRVLLGAGAVAMVAALVTAIVMMGLDRVPAYDPVRTFDAKGAIESVALSPDGRTALSGGESNPILWDTETGDQLRSFEHENVKALVFSPDGRFAVSGGYAGLKLWDVATGEEKPPFMGPEAYVSAVAFAPDGHTLLSSSYKGREDDKDLGYELILWDLETGKQLRVFEGLNSSARSVAFSADGSVVLAADFDRIKVWEVATGELLRTIESPEGHFHYVALASDGQTALSASSDATLKLWDLASGQIIRTLRGHDDIVLAIAFAPNGRFALSGSQDSTLRLWDVATGEELGLFAGHSADVASVVFGRDGSTAVSGGYDGTMKLWDVAVDE